MAPTATVIERLAFSTILISLLVSLACPCACDAQEDERIVVLDDSFYLRFGDKLTFHLEATSPAEITDVLLSYGPSGRGNAVNVRPDGLQPDSRILLDYAHDLKSEPIRVFTEIEFHWTIRDSRGHRLTTPPQKFVYTDNRFDWASLEADGLKVFSYDRSESFLRTALYVAKQARNRIMADMGGNPERPLELYIYANAADLHGTIQIDRREWLVGQAYPEVAACLVVIPTDQRSAQEMERVIPHEISHLLLGTLAAAPPYWLDEGLATDNEGVRDPNGESMLAAAAIRNQLIPLKQLCSSFPEDPQKAALAYAQSRSFVVFIRERYGLDGLQDLIRTFHRVNDCEIGVQEALGLSLTTLETQWKSSLPQRRSLVSILAANGAWIVLWLGTLIVTLLLIQSTSWPLRPG